jgi:hypothetical protein
LPTSTSSADVHRIFAAQLELHLDHPATGGLGDLAPVAYEPVKNTPSTGVLESAAPISPPPRTRDEHVGGHARFVQHLGERGRSASRARTACRAPRCRR